MVEVFKVRTENLENSIASSVPSRNQKKIISKIIEITTLEGSNDEDSGIEKRKKYCVYRAILGHNPNKWTTLNALIKQTK